jgi:presenilin-like A22 family membrane protease
MKHDLKTTLLLLLIFVLAQITGLALVNKDIAAVSEQGEITHQDTVIGKRPQTEGAGSLTFMLAAILVGTLLVLLIIRFRQVYFWKLWFFLAVWIAAGVALGVIFSAPTALIIALVLAIIKVWRHNVFFHNITEILMYAGIAVLLVPIFDVFYSAILLLVISAYDVYAVWKSKHMVKMAKFQTESKLFAGLFIPYKRVQESKPLLGAKTVKVVRKRKTAILGGGDIAFPLIFSGAVMESLISGGLDRIVALYETLIITAATTVSLFFLFAFAKKDKFYPAMPFVTAGCILGYLIILLI